MPGTTFARETPLQLITCLKWSPDGELCAEDRSLLLHRLMQIDGCEGLAPGTRRG